MLVGVVVVSLSWADASPAHEMMGNPSSDLQQATETDLDEIRNDVVTARFLEAHTVDSVRIEPSFPRSPSRASLPTAISRDIGLSELSVYRL